MSRNAEAELIDVARQSTGLVIFTGILLVILGVLALGAPLVAGISIAIAIGILLLAGGLVQLFLSFRADSIGAGLLASVVGGLKILAGVLVVTEPVLGLISLTLVLAAYFFIEGIFEIAWSLRLRPTAGWGWALCSGITALLLGMMIWSQFPLSGVWAVGMLVGIKLIFSGTTLAVLGSGLRSAARHVQPSAA